MRGHQLWGRLCTSCPAVMYEAADRNVFRLVFCRDFKMWKKLHGGR